MLRMLPSAYPNPRIDLGFRRPSYQSARYCKMMQDAREAVCKLEWALLLNSAGVGASKREKGSDT
jgi:hypothetical protein